MTSEETESLIREAKIARFCSLNKDGTIHVVPVWYMYENGQIVTATPISSRKARNVKRNKKVTVLIDISEGGVMPRCVIVYGKAEMDYDNVFPALASALERYMPKDKTEGTPKACSS